MGFLEMAARFMGESLRMKSCNGLLYYRSFIDWDSLLLSILYLIIYHGRYFASVL